MIVNYNISVFWEVYMDLRDRAREAKNASIIMATLSRETKDAALNAIITALKANSEEILASNKLDVDKAIADGLDSSIVKRLTFSEAKIEDLVDGIKSLIALEDPVGVKQQETKLDDDLVLTRISAPIGVIGVIFESRPDALVQISTLCLKSSNGVILKGGSEAINTNKILAKVINEATVSCGMPEGWITLATTREEVNEMLDMHEYIDLLIPRGSNQFVQYIMNNSKIPVLGHADGICHTYIDKYADIDMAVKVAVDAKTQYVSVCNATETILVHSDIAPKLLPSLKEALEAKSVEILGCDKTCKIIQVGYADDSEWVTEYLDYKVSIKVVDSLDEAIEHINNYGSGHTDAIITACQQSAELFMDRVDSGNVYWNCSTRFADGFRYGFGAEVGVSTSKIHARGPVGLEGLLIYKYKLYGNGNIVDDYATKKKKFKHIKVI